MAYWMYSPLHAQFAGMWTNPGPILAHHTTPLKKGEPSGQGGPPSGDEQVRGYTRLFSKKVNFYRDM